MIYSNPNQPDSPVQFKTQYGNYIGGSWVPPVQRRYFDNSSPINGQVFCSIPQSSSEDISLALDAAHEAKESWGKTSVTERSNILLKIADRIDENLEKLAVAETWDNGKAVRETLAADIPLSADHFRYFAGCIRAQEGSIGDIDENTVAYHFHEPLGVVGQIIPWNFPLLMACWKLAPALAAGNCVVLKPAEQTPASILILMEVIGDLIPAGVVNIVNGFGKEAGEALATSQRIAKIAFTGSTPVGSHIMKCAADNIIPSTVELGGKSPNIYFEDVLDHEDAFIDKCVEGAVLAFFNQGEVCTCPSRLLIQETIYDEFIAKVIDRAQKIKRGNPLDTETMIGAQASKQQFDKILSYVDIGKDEGAEILMGGQVESLSGEFDQGYYIQPTILKGHNKMRVFQEEIFGPVVSVTTFRDEKEALLIANDSEFGLSAGIVTNDRLIIDHFIDNIQSGMVQINLPTAGMDFHAPITGRKNSSFGPPEKSSYCREFFTNTKVVHANYGKRLNSKKEES